MCSNFCSQQEFSSRPTWAESLFLNMADGEGAERGKKYYDHLCKYLEGCEDATELSKTNVEKCKNKIVNTESACETTIRKVDI